MSQSGNHQGRRGEREGADPRAMDEISDFSNLSGTILELISKYEALYAARSPSKISTPDLIETKIVILTTGAKCDQSCGDTQDIRLFQRVWYTFEPNPKISRVEYHGKPLKNFNSRSNRKKMRHIFRRLSGKDCGRIGGISDFSNVSGTHKKLYPSIFGPCHYWKPLKNFKSQCHFLTILVFSGSFGRPKEDFQQLNGAVFIHLRWNMTGFYMMKLKLQQKISHLLDQREHFVTFLLSRIFSIQVHYIFGYTRQLRDKGNTFSAKP
jgi:hypothetical protein